jgi:hypothetical protein
MTQYEYQLKLNQINKDHQIRLRFLASDFAESNNPHKIGDIVKDTIGFIKIEQIQFTLGGGKYLPECVYTGIELTKKGEPNKRGNKRTIYQSNIKP